MKQIKVTLLRITILVCMMIITTATIGWGWYHLFYDHDITGIIQIVLGCIFVFIIILLIINKMKLYFPFRGICRMCEKHKFFLHDDCGFCRGCIQECIKEKAVEKGLMKNENRKR